MKKSRRLQVLVMVGLGVGLLVPGAAPPPASAQTAPPAQAPRPGPPGGMPVEAPRPTVPIDRPLKKAEQPLTAEQLTKEQFDRLPDTQPIEIKGQRMTAGGIRANRAKMRQARAEAEAKATAAAAKAQAEFEADRAKFLQEQKARLDTENAKVRAEVARLRQQRPAPAQSPQLDAIRREAGQLLERSKTASPAERVQIEQRAAQLRQQLQQMGHGR